MTKFSVWRHYRLYMLRKDLVSESERLIMEENLKYIISDYCQKNGLDYRDLVSEFKNRYEMDRMK